MCVFNSSINTNLAKTQETRFFFFRFSREQNKQARKKTSVKCVHSQKKKTSIHKYICVYIQF